MTSSIHQLPALGEFEALKRLSAQIGRNPLLTQGSSGNTSIKIGAELWVKASGKWLADADRENVFLPLDLEQVREHVRQELEIDCPASTGHDLRPSVETAMHAVLQHRVVMHVHSVNTIAAAIRADAQTFLERKLAGMEWAWVPYAPSGLPLAQQIERIHSHRPEVNVFVLGNHGLVVAGESCGDAEEALWQVEERLHVTPRAVPDSDEAYLHEVVDQSEWVLPRTEQVHALATDVMVRTVLANGVLYPCQAIFLHGSHPWRSSSEFMSDPRKLARKQLKWPFLIVNGRGVLVRRGMSDAEYETLAGLAEVMLRSSGPGTVRYLTGAESAIAGDVYRKTAQPFRHPSNQLV
jgi:rhamnose utilization protein RhaD (predicted bifunctional aldolase and dehydrogenase)